MTSAGKVVLGVVGLVAVVLLVVGGCILIGPMMH